MSNPDPVRAPPIKKPHRYCPMCDKWVPAHEKECRACGADTVKAAGSNQ